VISNSQKQVLVAIAREGKAKSVTSIAFVKKHSLKSPSTVQSALNSLYENETIAKEQDAYFITNRFFAFWIRKQYTGLRFV
jgi:predicted transcriptional regulator